MTASHRRSRMPWLALIMGIPAFGSGCAGDDAASNAVSKSAAALTTLSTPPALVPSSDAAVGTETPPGALPPLTSNYARLGASPPTGTKMPALRANPLLYSGQGKTKGGEVKQEKELTQTGTKAQTSPISADEYRTRAQSYLQQWERSKATHSQLSTDEQEAKRAELKRQVIGE